MATITDQAIYEGRLAHLLHRAMSQRTFADLRWAVRWLEVVRSGSRPLKAISAEPPAAYQTPPEPVSASRGAWIHSTFRDDPGGDPAYRWHLFTGDLAWRPAWDHVRLSTLCGVTLLAGDHLAARDEPGQSGACRRCLRKSQRSDPR